MTLTIRGLSKTYRNGTQALRDVSLDIPKGMFGLLGRNGAGKSTLMRILATLQDPDQGSAHLGDIDVLAQKSEIRKTLGYLPQSFGFHPRARAQRLLEHFAVLKGITERSVRRDVVEALLRQTNLWDVRGDRLGTFSGGMRQRFGVAVAMLGDPQLIIVDEPTAGLDPEERVRFLNLLSQIGEDCVVILSTHIVEDVEELCSRMAIIDDGGILLEGEPAHALDELRGKIWARNVSRQELSTVREVVPVISTKLFAGRTSVRVFSDARPGAEYEPVEPRLEDVYFCVMGGHQGARSAGATPTAAASP